MGEGLLRSEHQVHDKRRAQEPGYLGGFAAGGPRFVSWGIHREETAHFLLRRLITQRRIDCSFGPRIAQEWVIGAAAQDYQLVRIHDFAVQINTPALTRRRQVTEPPAVGGIMNFDADSPQFRGQALPPLMGGFWGWAE